MSHDKDREILIDWARRHLEATGRPRLTMLAIYGFTIAAGVLASTALLGLGLDRMVFRYPLAVGVAYAAFLGALRVWLAWQRAAVPITDDPEGLFVPGLAALGAAKLGADLAAGADAAEDEQKRQGSSFFDFGNGGGGGGGDLGDIGEGCGVVLVLVAVAALCMLIVGVYVVATSPVLLAELLVDGVLLGAMAKAVGPEPPRHWSQSLHERTAPAAIIAALVFAFVGLEIQHAAPRARTMAEALVGTPGRP